jgi:hypothetical protein
MRKEDTWEFQTAGLKKLLEERAPGKAITFDDNHKLTVRFLVLDSATGTNLVGSSGEWLPDKLSEMSDEKLWETVQHLSNGKL